MRDEYVLVRSSYAHSGGHDSVLCFDLVDLHVADVVNITTV